MNTSEENQKVVIEGYNHGQIFVTDVDCVNQVSGKLYGKVYVDVYGSPAEFTVMYEPSKGVWECSSVLGSVEI